VNDDARRPRHLARGPQRGSEDPDHRPGIDADDEQPTADRGGSTGGTSATDDRDEAEHRRAPEEPTGGGSAVGGPPPDDADARDEAGRAGEAAPAGVADRGDEAGGDDRDGGDQADRRDGHGEDIDPGPSSDEAGAPWRPWALAALLAGVSVVASISALVVDRDTEATSIGAPSPGTPVLSARRAPELVAAPVANRRLRADLQAWLASSPSDTCVAVDLAGDPVFEHRADVPLTGASTQKLLTATGLLLALGPDARFETRALATSTPSDGVLAGDVYIVGGGDALLATTAWRDHFTRQPRTINDIDQLAQDIADAGITRIEGSVVGDGSRYDEETYHPVWPARFVDQDAVGPIGGLMVNDGFAEFPPEGEGYAETIPADDPAEDAARVLTERLFAAGVEVEGSPRSGDAPASGVEVAVLESPAIADVAAEMVLESDNETAEVALKELGVVVAGEGSWPAGAAALDGLLAGAGITLEGVEIVDGSGLSIENRLTCAALIEVLTHPETGAGVREGLPVAGRTGTLADRWVGSPLEGRLRAKTGTLRNVAALAGEVDATGGHTLRFAYVANVADPGTIDLAMVDQAGLADILAEYPRNLHLDALGPAAGTPAETPVPPQS
jgi:serine-type D-Ala-D-Ala carboxypeptidase/endopeptidase (penicillin-binding protein 4)